MAVIDGKVLLTKNDCYKRGAKMTPKGIVVHSTGVNNPELRRYIAPDDGVIGKNAYNNDWNRPGLSVCVHAFIGKDKNGKVRCYQTLPFNICCWGVGGGSKGSYNYNPPYIQFEMCEDGLRDEKYCTEVYKKAVKLCAKLCKKYNIPVDKIVSHEEAHYLGYGSGHVDPTNWWKHHGYTMDTFRKAVKKKLLGSNTKIEKAAAKVETFTPYVVKLTAAVNLRKGAGTNYEKTATLAKGGTYTITAEAQGKGSTKGWGKLKSGAGWISLDYAKRA